MDTLQCAIVLAKLERFDWEIAQRLEKGERYQQLLADVPGVRRLAVRDDRDCVWAQFTIFVDDRKAVQAGLQAAGIPTAVHYPRPLHHQPAYAHHARPDDCPRSIAAAQQVLSLPMSADLAAADQQRVVDTLARVLAGQAAAV
jgi:UDP-2-acetamido-2-deoxy-ribo-hexuluronate aminotransferase